MCGRFAATVPPGTAVGTARDVTIGTGISRSV